MISVRNNRDLKIAYETLNLYREYAMDKSDKIQNLKREMRKFVNKPISEERIVHDDGMDGYIVLIPLPVWIRSMEDAEEFFMENLYIRTTYSAFDCTGRSYTQWYKLFKRNNQFCAYHSIGFDF